LSKPRSVVLAVLLVSAAVRASAYRAEIIATRGGTRLRGSEVCFFPGREGETPIGRLFATNTTRCYSADQVIDLPPGRWNFYTKSSDGWIAAGGGAFVHEGPPAPERFYKAITVELQRAAWLDFSEITPRLATGEHIAVYLVERRGYAFAAIPLPPGETKLMVPAMTSMIPLIVRHGVPVQAGKLVSTGAGETTRVPSIDAPEGKRDVIGWLQVDESAYREGQPPLAPPSVEFVGADGSRHKAAFSYVSTGPLENALAIFDDLPIGAGNLVLSGAQWQKFELKTELRAESRGEFVNSPIQAVPASSLRVAWTIAAAKDLIGTSAANCMPEPTPLPLRLRLSRCSDVQPGAEVSSVDRRACRHVHQETVSLASASGDRLFEGLAPGTYVVDLGFDSLRSRSTLVALAPAAAQSVDVDLSFRLLFGSVTKRGKPVRAAIDFEYGRAVSDDTGEYVAVLSRPVEGNAITVRPCDGAKAYSHFPPDDIDSRNRYEIRIPSNEIRVTVTDTESHQPITNAEVGVLAPLPGEAVKFGGADDRTDSTGAVTLTQIPDGAEIVVCARASDYPFNCTDRMKVDIDEVKAVAITLKGARTFRGKIVTPTPMAGGWVYWTPGNGTVSEAAAVNDDGSFEYRRPHDAGEAIVVTSQSFPLFTIPQPSRGDDGALVVAPPQGNVRSFRVATATRGDALFTIAIGNVQIPLDALSAHLTRRGLVAEVISRGPARVSDILESAPLSVILHRGPRLAGVAPADYFVRPELAPALVKKALQGDIVSFDE